jgi:hypothetical protein
MPSTCCTITLDTSHGMTFIVRMFDSSKDIGVEVPIDAWESHEVYVDEGTLDYLNDKNIVEYLRRKK